MPRGFFITLEGIDGTGKSTQIKRLVRYLRGRGIPAIATREPGGTKTGERIRAILLSSNSGKIAPLTELALMYAARAQHIEEVVRPALARGKVVISDRFNDASFAYQGYGRMLGPATVRALDKVICGRTQPNLTLLLDLDPREALGRAQTRNTRQGSKHARFENQGLKFQQRVRAGYLALARQHPRRIKRISALGNPAEIQERIREAVNKALARRRTAPLVRD